MSGGGQQAPTTTTQTSEPPAYQLPYLQQAAAAAQGIYNGGGPAYYPGQTVATPSAQTTQGLTNITNLAQQGGTLTPAANATLLSTIQGTGGINPFLADAVKSANAPLFDQFQNQTVPTLQSIFARAGGTGGSAENAGFDQATTALGRGVGQNAGALAYQAADQERRNQLQASMLAPQMDATRYNDANALLGVGATYDTQNQANINADIAKYNYNSNLPSLALNQYIQQLQGTGRGGITTGTSYTPHPSFSPILGGLGGAASGAAAGSLFGPVGIGVGAGIGELAGIGSSNGWF